ncbi:MAG: family 16 glycosylhydrolase, partial [Pseudomonadota bacterium]
LVCGLQFEMDRQNDAHAEGYSMRGRFGRSPSPRLGFGIHLLSLLALLLLWLSAVQLTGPEPRNPILGAGSLQSGDELVRRSQSGAPGQSFVRWFADGHDEEDWYRSDFDLVENAQRVGWSADHVTFEDGAAHLWITNRPSPTNPHTSGEYQKRGWYGFGRFEVIMKAAEGSGLVSSFFTHTGSYFGDPHDEIDFEFLGKDTTKVWLNWFRDGVPGESKWHQLDFDATDDFHLYAFEWTPETIRWYVDGELVYERPEDSLPVPITPGRIIVNLWSGREAQYDWHGRPDFNVASHASYHCVSYRSLDDSVSKQCSDGWVTRVNPVSAGSLQVASG